MKTKTKSIIVVLSFGFITTATFSQTQNKVDDKIQATFCNIKDQDVVKYADLLKCDEVICPDENYRIVFFTFCFFKRGTYNDCPNSYGKFNSSNLKILKTLEQQKVKRIMIENIKVIEKNGTKEKYIKGLVINLE